MNFQEVINHINKNPNSSHNLIDNNNNHINNNNNENQNIILNNNVESYIKLLNNEENLLSKINSIEKNDKFSGSLSKISNNKNISLNYYNLYNSLNNDYNKTQNSIDLLTSNSNAIAAVNNSLLSLSQKNDSNFRGLSQANTNTNTNTNPFINLNNASLANISNIPNTIINSDFMNLNSYSFNSIPASSTTNPSLLHFNNQFTSISNGQDTNNFLNDNINSTVSLNNNNNTINSNNNINNNNSNSNNISHTNDTNSLITINDNSLTSLQNNDSISITNNSITDYQLVGHILSSSPIKPVLAANNLTTKTEKKSEVLNSEIFSDNNNDTLLNIINDNIVKNKISGKQKINSSPSYMEIKNNLDINSLSSFNSILLNSQSQAADHNTDSNILNLLDSLNNHSSCNNNISTTDSMDTNCFNLEEDIDYYNFLKAVNTESYDKETSSIYPQQGETSLSKINQNNNKIIDYSILRNASIETTNIENITTNNNIYNPLSLSHNLATTSSSNSLNNFNSISINNKIPSSLNYNILHHSLQNSSYPSLMLDPSANISLSSKSNISSNRQSSSFYDYNNLNLSENQIANLLLEDKKMDLDYCPSEPESDDNVDEIEKCSESMPLSDELTYLLTDATLGLKDQNLTIDQVLKGVEDAPVYRRTRKNLSLEKFNMDSLDGMLSASLASNVNKLNIDKESVEYRRFCMDITHGTKNISDDDDGEYNEQSKNQTNDIDYTKSVSVEELDDLFQDFIQDPNEINRNTAELKNDITTPNWVIDEKHLFSQEQIELLKKQMLQNFQIVTQAYAIEKELRGPDSIQAGHWKSQLMEMDQCICWSDTQKEEAMINSEKYIEKEKEKDEINENKNGKGKESEVDKDTLSKVNIKCEGALSIKQSYFEIPGFDRLSRLFEIPYDNSSTKSRQFSRNFSRQYSKSEVIKYRTADDIDKRVKFKSIVPVQLPESIEQMIEIYSDVFDPNLIPDILRVRRGRMRFLPIEDELLLAGLKRFGDDDWFSIRAYYLPTKTRKQLKTRYKNLISRRTPESPVKDWYLEQFKPLIYLEREVIQSCTQLYGKSFKVIIRDLFPHQPEFLLKRTWEELYTYGEVGYSWEFSKGEIKKSKQEILLIGKQLKLYYKQCDEKSSDNKKIRITNPCVYRLNDGNSVVFGSNADLKELDDQMAKARLQRGLPIDYDSFKVKSVRGNRLVLGNDKAVWVLPNQYIKSSNKNVNTKKQKRKLDTLKSELSRIKPSKLLKLNNNKLPISSISNSTNSSSILIDNSVITTNKRINNITTTIPKNIYFKSKNTHSSIQPKITNKNDSIPKVSVVLTSSPMKNSLMSSKINRHIKNPNQKIVKIYNHTGSRNGLKGSKIQADLSTVTMNKDNEALFAPLIENVCDQVASRVMDSIIAKMINKSIDILVDDKEMNNYLNSSLSNTTSNSSSTTMYNHISSLTNRILHHHH